MDTLSAHTMGEASRGKPLMVFDWDKAARLIKALNAKEAMAGLAGDWGWTGGVIFVNGEPYTEGYTFLASTWATPELEVDGMRMDCYRMESEVPGWDCDTKWPESALAILRGDAQ